MHAPDLARRAFFPAAALCLLGAAGFAAAYGQAPLYYSNQNQYLLHGMAWAGEGLLAEDWLANTRDPTPVFSALVALTARCLHPWAFYLYHALLSGAYATAMLGLFVALVGEQLAARRWPVFLALFVAVHSALARWCSYHWLGQDYPWYLQTGLAGQYALGAMFQPSMFAALLVVAVCLFVRDRPFLAAAFAALAATVHPTYLLHAGLLTLGCLVALYAEGRARQAVWLGTWALALVLPVTAFVLIAFRPTSPEAFAEAQDILVNVRIPHHARPDLWLDEVAALQVAWVVLGIALTRRTRLFFVLAVPFVLALLLTLTQVATDSNTLALLFPWRVSVVLVPVATTVILSRLVAVPRLPLDGRVAWAASAVAVLVLAAGGVWISAARLAFNTDDEELPLMEFVRTTRAPGDVYFLPVRVPDLVSATRGSQSGDFKPLQEKRTDVRIIPIDLQRFRLFTGTPIYVDFKSIPYQDIEVIEWYDRLLRAQTLQEQIKEGWLSKDVLAGLRGRGVTHLVVSAGREYRGSGLAKVYEDARYQVYRLNTVQ